MDIDIQIIPAPSPYAAWNERDICAASETAFVSLLDGLRNDIALDISAINIIIFKSNGYPSQ